jgi:hypothetical protein
MCRMDLSYGMCRMDLSYGMCRMDLSYGMCRIDFSYGMSLNPILFTTGPAFMYVNVLGVLSNRSYLIVGSLICPQPTACR